MQGTQRRVYEMFARSRDFKQSRAASFPAASRGGELFAELEEVLAVIEEHTEVQGSQASAAVQGTANRKAARVALQKSLEAIYRTARAMSYATPGLDKLFRLPRGSNDQSLLIAARGLQGRFVLAGFRNDVHQFLPNLDLAVMSSFTEGLPVILLETGAAGVPTGRNPCS